MTEKTKKMTKASASVCLILATALAFAYAYVAVIFSENKTRRVSLFVPKVMFILALLAYRSASYPSNRPVFLEYTYF